MKNYIRKVRTFLILGVFAAALPIFGQITGDLQITVSDASNAVIPNATVVVTSAETGTTRTVTTDASGAVRVNQLAVGRYGIKVMHDGFTTVATNTQVNSGNIGTVPITLSIASANQQIQVTEQAAVMNTVNAQLQ